MRFQIVQSSGILQRFIRDYCLMETDACETSLKERVIPVENMQLMFHYKMPFAVCGPKRSLLTQPRTIISGLNNTFDDVVTLGESGVIFVNFRAAGACQFFKIPLSEFENGSYNLADVMGSSVRQVEEQLCLTSGAKEKIMVVEKFLLKILNPVASHDFNLVQQGIRMIRAHGGQITAADLAGSLAVTPKTLERKFAAFVGKTPKQYGKLIRFRKILADFSTLKNTNLTEYAYRNGYFDQSHFIHDFKIFTGYTPREFLLKYPDCSSND